MEFKSKVFIENRRKKSVLRGAITALCLIFFILILFKVFMGDFSISEISTLFISLLLIFGFVRSAKHYPVYAETIGKAEFEDEELKITYVNVDGGTSIGTFSQTTIVRYEDIESIEYGEELCCYRIVAPCDTQRIYEKYQKKETIQNKDSVNEIFIYFLDPDESSRFSKILQVKAKRIIRHLSLDDE